MASTVLLLNNAIGNPKNFLQSTSHSSTDFDPQDLSLNQCESNLGSSFDNSKLNSMLNVSTHLSVSHLGFSVHDLDSLATNQVTRNVWTGTCRLALTKPPHSTNQSLEASSYSADCPKESSIESSRSGSVCRELSESKISKSLKSSQIVTPDDLITLINNQEAVLLIDCRSFMAFNSNHINGALNASCSDRITRKRLVDGKIKVVDLVSGQEAKEIYRRLEDEAEIILYDENTVEMGALPETNSLQLLSSCLLKHGKHSKFLQGGLQVFQQCYSFMCSQPDAGAGVPMLYSPTSPEINCQIDTAVASEILPYLFIGNQRDAANRERLNELGVTHILNVTNHLPLHFENEGIVYKRLPATDSGSQNLKQYFSEAIQFIECARKSNGKVLVHCQAGVSRSPAIVTAYLIATSSKTLMNAFTVIKDRRPIVAPNINFMGQLLEFEQQGVTSSGFCPLSQPVQL